MVFRDDVFELRIEPNKAHRAARFGGQEQMRNFGERTPRASRNVRRHGNDLLRVAERNPGRCKIVDRVKGFAARKRRRTPKNRRELFDLLTRVGPASFLIGNADDDRLKRDLLFRRVLDAFGDEVEALP